MIGNKIKDIRVRRGLTQGELAKKVGVSQRVISKWELNVTAPPMDIAKKIADALEVKVAYLFDEYEVDKEVIRDFVLEAIEEKLEREKV